MAYQRTDIERVRAATNIVELLEAVTTVKRTGRTYKAICPFHQEKTPSLSIDPGQGLFHCFGCGAGGDVFKFVEMTQGLDFSEAVEYLASRAGIPLQRDPKAAKARGEREALVEVLKLAVDFYRERLKKGADAGPARSYLRGRGYDGDVIDRFDLGYAPDSWTALVDHLRDRKVPEKVMVGAGLAVRTSRGRLRDWFRGRIMFPIFDLRGDPVGFGARIVEGDGPKYLNSPETRLYQKARLLYGLNWAKADIARSGYSIVVEGYTDVIAMHLAGMPQAVATCGTALGEEHFDLLRRFADKIVLAFDADQAGAGAALRGDELETPVRLDLDVRVAVMPEGRDPADLAQEGDVDLLAKAVDGSRPLLQFRLEQELAGFDLSEPEGRARAIRRTAELLARQPDQTVRREYARFVARKVGTEFEAILAAVERARRPSSRGAQPPDAVEEVPERPTGVQRAERELLRVMAANDPRLEGLVVTEDLFSTALHRSVLEVIRDATRDLPPGQTPELGAVIGERDDPAARLVRALLLDDRPLGDPAGLVRRLRVAGIEQEIATVRRELEGTEAGSERHSQLLTELIALERRKRTQ